MQEQANADGTVTQSVSLRPLFRRTAAGLVAVEPSVRSSTDRSAPASAEGALRPIRFGAEASQVARLDLDGGPVTLSAPGLRIGAPRVEPDGVVYGSVAADIDLSYRVSAGGLKEEVTLGSSSAPTTFSFHLSDPKGALGAASPTPGGGYRFANRVDDATVELPPPFAYEQKSVSAGGSAPRDLSSASMKLTEAGDGWDLTVSVNPEWLAGKSFPVVLDPTVAFSNGNAYDGTYSYTPNRFPGCPGCGGVNGADPIGGTGTYHDALVDMEPTRTAFRFDLSTIPAGSAVTAASLNLYLVGCLGNTPNYYCDQHSYPVQVRAFTAGWNPGSATWNSLNAITPAGAFGGYTQPAFGPGGWTPPISMTGQVQSWVNGAANNGFALMLPPQPPNWGGPAYASSDNASSPHPYLSVTYNPKVPGAPTNVTATAANASAQVNWAPPASNGGAVIDSYAVNVYNPDGTYAGIQAVACGTCTTVTVSGLTNGKGYYFGVFAHNSVNYGPPTYTGFLTPAVPPGAPTNVQGSVSTGWYHSIIGRPDGTVAAFGLNNVGQLGNNTTVDAHVPTAVPGLSGVTQVAAGYAHSVALRSDGTVWAWGYNAYGELGINSTVESNVPVQVPGLSGVVAVSTSFLHNLALRSDGTVWAWGYNSNGQLGNNTTVDSHVPIQVPGLTNIVSVSAGYEHSLVLRADGAVFAFGLNNLGQLGNNSTVDAHAPIQVYYVVSAVAVSAGLAHSVALRGDGTVLTWGYNGYGQLGNNSTVNAPVAIQVPGLTGVTSISAQGGYDTMARKSDGNLWAWGYNGYGGLGNNSTAQSNVPIQVPGLAGVTQATAGLYHSLAVKADGGLAAFGYNAQGQLGTNTVIDAHVPVTPTGPGVAASSATLAATGGVNSLSVTWAAPVATGGDPITAYAVTLYQGTPGSGVLTTTQTCAGPCPTATFTGLAGNTSYYVTVAAVTAAGTGPVATSNPAVTLTEMSGAGERDFFTYQTASIDDRTTAKVNVGTGNLEVTVAGLAVPVVGGTRSLAQVYNSLALTAGATGTQSAVAGYGWRFNDAPDRRLLINTNGSVTFVSGTGNAATFTATSFTAPPGLDATLAHNGDGTWTMTYHQTAEKLTFRADGLLTSDADRNNNTVAISYPGGGGYETSITGTAGTAPGNTVNLAYTAAGGKLSGLAQTADGATRTVGYTYDAAGNLYQVTDAAGRLTTFTYDTAHNLTQIQTPTGHQARFTYDGTTHRVATLTRVIPEAVDAVTRYDYTTTGHSRLTDADNHPPVDYTVDANGRVTTVLDAKGNATSTTYTPDAQVDTATNAAGGPTVNTYGANAGESRTQTAGPLGATAKATFTNPAPKQYLADTTTDPMGNQSTYTYDGPGNLASTADALAATASVAHNTDGTVSTATDPKNASPANPTIYSYTDHQVTSVTPPTGNTLVAQSFTYDGAGRLRTATSGKGVTTTNVYDSLDRLRTQTFSDTTPTVGYVYDDDGNLTSRTDTTGATGYGYDSANRLRSKTLPGNVVLGYTYDPAGNLATLTDGRGTTTYHYDKANKLDQMTESNGRINIYAYNADHKRVDTWDNTGTAVAYDATGNNVIPPVGFAVHIHNTLDKANRLTEIKTTRASSDTTVAADLSYCYSPYTAGQACPTATATTDTSTRQWSKDNLTGAVTTYTYATGRLTTAATATGPTYTYAYDADGNRTTDSAGTHTYNSANQLTDTGVTHDADGNLTATPAYPTLTYNGTDQTTTATAAGQTGLTLGYAGTDQTERTTAGSTTYNEGGVGLQSQTVSCGLLCTTTTYFERDPDGGLVSERTGTAEYYYTFDGIGSVIGLTDPAGTPRAAYTYDPYGNNATATALNGTLPTNPYRYASGYLDPTGLYHYGARYYDPALGRFTQQDTIITLGNPANGNRYAYTGDNPINHVDINGYSDSIDTAAITGDVLSGCAVGAADTALAAGAATVISGQFESFAAVPVGCVAGAAVSGFADANLPGASEAAEVLSNVSSAYDIVTAFG